MEDAIRKYCLKQSETGLAASQGMVYGLIYFLKAVEYMSFLERFFWGGGGRG
jgi:hypothetical protein